ncbi:unnamed protein product [Candidula unifasciata]|uniref:Tectonic domain-containing protein n=1 Tax=Candidula unifasciata TaxID=100452 RepID=A0A8S3ZV41_9EUPU|nr:unnamed protein product [Candidula unifasciata]
MAAKCVNMFKLGLIVCIGSILICSSWSQNDTTTIEYNTTDIDNTTTSTMTTTVPTTSLPTTTTIKPSVPGTTIPANVDVSKCPCDLTGNACDVGCCCDPDCSDADRAVFTPCQPFSYVLDDKLCFDRNVFFLENGPARSGDSGDLFCIYFDNDEKRNYYINPSLVTTEAEFLSYAAKYRKFSFQSVVPSTSVRNFNPFYKRGDPIYVVFPDNAVSLLALPAAVANSPLCTDSNPAAYLIDKSYTCARTLSNLPEDCVNNTGLRASTFYENFRIIRDTFLLKEFNSSSRIQHPILGSVDLTEVTSLYNNSYTVALSLDPDNPLQCMKNGVTGNCSFTEPMPPVYNATTQTCQNALLGVRYRFVTNGTLGIDSAFVSFIFSDVGYPNIAQTFSTTFTTVSSTGERIQRSGHPGYQVGQPIMAGVLNVTSQGATTDERILLQQARGQQLALIRGSVSGDCLMDLGQLREPVLFGQDMRTGCFIQVNETSEAEVCKMLQQLIIRVIEGYSAPAYDATLNVYLKNNLYVAMFGDSDVQRTGDWVEVLFKNRPSSPSQTVGAQCDLSLGANLQILYANVGSLPNPQAKIIGVAYVYDEPQVVRYKCSGSFCQPGSSMSQKVEISSSVTFIDVSQLPVAVEGVYPTTAARLPYDFFYPFLSDAPRSLHAGHLCWFLCLLCVLNMLRH